MIEYRRAGDGDVGALTRLRMEFLAEGNETSADQGEALRANIARYFEKTLADGSFIAFVAADGSAIVATSGLTVYTLPPGVAFATGVSGYISNMYTAPAYRKQGIATRLFGMIMEEAARQGCSRLMLSASAMGRPIYERYGFAAAHKVMTYVYDKK